MCKSTVDNNQACYSKISIIPLFSMFFQEILIPLVKNSGQITQIFGLIMLGEKYF